MFDYGLEAHREREHELQQFRDAIEAVKQDNRQLAAAKIDEFMLYKRKVCHYSVCPPHPGYFLKNFRRNRFLQRNRIRRLSYLSP